MKDRLTNVRKQLHLDQCAAAKRLDVDLETYCAWESGTAPIPDDMIDMVCESYHINRKWLEEGKGKKYAPIFDLLENYLEKMRETYRKAVPYKFIDTPISISVTPEQWNYADEEEDGTGE